MSIGELLREWRDGRSLRAAGSEFGCSQTTYRAWEADFAIPGPEFYEGLMQKLGLDAARLVTAIGESVRRRSTSTLALLAKTA